MNTELSCNRPGGFRPARVEEPGPKMNRTRGWLTILAAALSLVIFIYVIGPIGLETPYFKPIAQFIEESGINANGYYYTDVAEFADAERNMQYTMDYMPRQ